MNNAPLPTQTRIIMQTVRRKYGVKASLDQLQERVNQNARGTLAAEIMLAAIAAERAYLATVAAKARH